MPDRMTNTIDLASGGVAYRPTAISSFAGNMATVDTWWPLWKDFLFGKKLELPDKKGAGVASKLPAALLSKIPRSKYPALTEEDEAMSLRLQTVCLAIFDAILVHMLNQARAARHPCCRSPMQHPGCLPKNIGCGSSVGLQLHSLHTASVSAASALPPPPIRGPVSAVRATTAGVPQQSACHGSARATSHAAALAPLRCSRHGPF